MPKCDRCRKDTLATTMSFFNTDTLCLSCWDKERNHPDYARAVQVETEAVRRGNYKFPGIGKPSDL